MFLPLSTFFGIILSLLLIPCFPCYTLPPWYLVKGSAINETNNSMAMNSAINNLSHKTSNTNETAFKKNHKLEDKELLMKKTRVFDRDTRVFNTTTQVFDGDTRMKNKFELCGNGKQYCRHPLNYPYRY